MRIIAGEWGGRPLEAPRGRDTRPTSDRVREALFSILGDVVDLRVLDLFAGTGAFALEALSRGAQEAACVERGRPALTALRANVERLGASDRVKILNRDAHTFRPEEPFDLVFADPPWKEAQRFSETLVERGEHLVAPEGRLVLERAARDDAPPALAGFDGPRTRRYGDALLAFYERRSG